MYSLPAEGTQSWFIAKAALALIPMLTFGALDVIGWFLRGVRWLRSEVVPGRKRTRAISFKKLRDHPADLAEHFKRFALGARPGCLAAESFPSEHRLDLVLLPPSSGIAGSLNNHSNHRSETAQSL
jgi:hypothetical protein